MNSSEIKDLIILGKDIYYTPLSLEEILEKHNSMRKLCLYRIKEFEGFIEGYNIYNQKIFKYPINSVGIVYKISSDLQPNIVILDLSDEKIDNIEKFELFLDSLINNSILQKIKEIKISKEIFKLFVNHLDKKYLKIGGYSPPPSSSQAKYRGVMLKSELRDVDDENLIFIEYQSL